MVFIHFICKRLGGERPSREALAVEVVGGGRGRREGREVMGERGRKKTWHGEEGLGQKRCERKVKKKKIMV